MPFDIHAANCSHFHIIISQFHSKILNLIFLCRFYTCEYNNDVGNRSGIVCGTCMLVLIQECCRTVRILVFLCGK